MKQDAEPAVSAFPIAVTLLTIICFEAGAAVTKELFHTLGALGADASPTTPAEFDRMIALELVENAALVKEAGIKVQ